MSRSLLLKIEKTVTVILKKLFKNGDILQKDCRLWLSSHVFKTSAPGLRHRPTLGVTLTSLTPGKLLYYRIDVFVPVLTYASCLSVDFVTVILLETRAKL